METLLFRDHEVAPTEENLEAALGAIYPVYRELTQIVTGEGFGLTSEWNYYKDGKSWLCKVTHKKKTVFWLSVWEGYFQVGLYFTAAHLDGIAALSIAESIKEGFSQNKSVGKLLPMVFKVKQSRQLTDLLTVIRYKMSLK